MRKLVGHFQRGQVDVARHDHGARQHQAHPQGHVLRRIAHEYEDAVAWLHALGLQARRVAQGALAQLNEAQLTDVAILVLVHNRHPMPVAQRLLIEQILDRAISYSVHPASRVSRFQRRPGRDRARLLCKKTSIGSGISPHQLNVFMRIHQGFSCIRAQRTHRRNLCVSIKTFS
ncbi:hypothetical protein D3C85_1198120 [compost metagenome]